MSDDYGYDTELPIGDAPDDPGSKTWRLGLAAGALLVAGVLLFLHGLGIHIAGYALASLVAFTLVALFRRAAVNRLGLVGVGTPDSLNGVAFGILAGGLVVAVLHAYAIARHFA